MSYSGGVFSINSTGQPVVSGTTISASVFNALTSDLATGLSTCMLKDGTQTATAGIGFYAGTVSLPGIYFGTDTATGFYRIGLNNNGYTVNGTKLWDWSAAAATLTGALTVSAGITLSGTASNITIGSNYISNGGTDAGLSFDSSNNATFSAALTATGALTAGTSSVIGGASSGNLTVGALAPNGNGSSFIRMVASNSTTNWIDSTNNTISGAFEIIPSTAGGGTTFTTPEFVLKSTAGGSRLPNGIRIGADSTNNLLDDASNGASTATLYIGNASINVTSDVRIKKNIRPTERDALALGRKIVVIDHEWDDPTDTAERNRNSRGSWMGIAAQQAVDYVPWLINAPDPNCPDCKGGNECSVHVSTWTEKHKNGDEEIETVHSTPMRWGFDMQYSMPFLLKMIQQLDEKVTALENR